MIQSVSVLKEIIEVRDGVKECAILYQQQLCSNSFNQYVITVSHVIKGIGHLKHGTT